MHCGTKLMTGYNHCENKHYERFELRRFYPNTYNMGHRSDGSVGDVSTPVCGASRQRMIPWLKHNINSGLIPGLQWLDKERQVFKVPWKRVANREWTENDGTIFKEWAKHTGRFREGVDQPDWPTWKTRFRTALTKLPDIKELREHNQLDGQTEEPYRVYQFVPRSSGGSTSRAVKMEPNAGTGADHEQPSMAQNVCHGSIIPSTVNSAPNSMGSGPGSSSEPGSDPAFGRGERMDSDLERISCSDLIKLSGEFDIKNISIDMKMDTTDDPGVNRGTVDRLNLPMPSTSDLDENDCKLYITVSYLRLRVFEQLCSRPGGVRIFYDTGVPVTNVHEYREFFGSENAYPIRLPAYESEWNNEQARLTRDVLQAADRGLFLQVRSGSLFATRKCRSRIYVSTPSWNNGQTLKLERDVETNLFDLHGYFKPTLDRFLHQRGPMPSAEVIISFGQNFDNDRNSTNNLLVWASVVHTEAQNLLTRIMCTSPITPPLDFSKSNTLDNQLALMCALNDT